MVKTAIAGVIFLASAAIATSASAAKYKYTFGTESGGAYCDGVNLTVSGVLVTGNHIAVKGSGCTEGDYAGGFASSIKGTGKLLEVTTTDDNNAPGLVLDFLIQPSTSEWALYAESDSEGIAFEEVNAGVLIKGDAPAKIAKGGNHPAIYKFHAK